jgi:CBS domain containing-hemolysin-like protein
LTAHILTIIVVLLVAVIFLGFEFALLEDFILNPKTEKKDRGIGLRIIQILIKNQRLYVTTYLFGRLVSIGLLCYLICQIANLQAENQLIAFIHILFLIIISSLLILVFGFFLPITLFKIGQNKTIGILAIPMIIIYVMCFPITKLVFELSLTISNIFISKKYDENQEGKLYLGSSSDKSEGAVNQDIDLNAEIEHDLKIFQNALEFSKTKLRDCSIPRNEIEAIELNSPIEKLKERFIETGYSKILIYHDTIDNIIGYAQSNDLFRSPKSIESILKNLVIVPETMPANKLMNLFLKEHKSIALVVDEFGGTYGLATLEDIMEEIFGEIEDEHDSTDFREEKISDNEYIFSGRLEIDYINEKYSINIPESEEYATIAGFILHYNEEIPKENDKIKIGKFELEIIKMLNPKIELVKLKSFKKT